MGKNFYRPDVFVRESLKFMQGYPKWKVWLYMPFAYCKMLYYAIEYKYKTRKLK